MAKDSSNLNSSAQPTQAQVAQPDLTQASLTAQAQAQGVTIDPKLALLAVIDSLEIEVEVAKIKISKAQTDESTLGQVGIKIDELRKLIKE